MNKQETFKREAFKAGFDIEMFNGKPAVRVSKHEVNDLLKIITVECERKDFPRFVMVFPK